MDIYFYILLIAGTVFLIIFSYWASIKDKRYHGIFRFFSFESLFILILLNYHYWFVNPFGILQIFSWIFLLSSTTIAVIGFYLLKYVGKPKGKIENTSNLITISLYKYIRHPLYLSLILLGFGIFFKHIDIIQIILLAINLVSIVLTAKIEEKELINKFGTEYKEYINKTKMFIPYLF